MRMYRPSRINSSRNVLQIILSVFAVMLSVGPSLQAAELPDELPLWENPPGEYSLGQDVKEQIRSYTPRPGAPSGSNRVFSSVSSPTYSIHRPKNPNGVGLVICPGGGFKDVWIDHEGHDLAIWLSSFVAWLSDSNIIQQ